MKKKNITIMGLVVMLVCALMLSGCANKTNNEKEAEQKNTSFAGTVWKSDTIETGHYLRLEVLDDENYAIYAIKASNDEVAVVEPGTYSVEDTNIKAVGKSVKETKYIVKRDVINITFTNDVNIDFYRLDDKLFTRSEYEKLLEISGGYLVKDPNDVPQTGDTESESESETESDDESGDGPTKTGNGYTYTVAGYEWTIPIRIEDYIHDGYMELSEVDEALGFNSGGDLRDENDNLIANGLKVYIAESYNPSSGVVGLYAKDSTLDTIFYEFHPDKNTTDEKFIIHDIHHDSKYVENATGTIDQMVLAIYCACFYQDGEAHSDRPLSEKASDCLWRYGPTSRDRLLIYVIP